MKKIILSLVLGVSVTFANINVDTTYSTFGAIVKRIGANHVNVIVLGSSKYDPHFIVPKPSLLAKLRRADLLIINGGGLELGWLPPLLRGAHNRNIQNGAKGFLDLSHFIPLIDVPTSVSRAFGDAHAQGNPHYSTDPHLVPKMAEAILNKLKQIDSANASSYEKNYQTFMKEWKTYLTAFDAKMLQCKTKKVVQYHLLFNYFLKRYNIESFGNIEPLPGISPSSKHTIELIGIMKQNGVEKILQDVYHEKKSSKFIASKTQAEIALIPHDVGSLKGSETLETFYNTIEKKLCQ